MFDLNDFQQLTLKYGSVASWAVWNENDLFDTSIIDSNCRELHSRYVLLGLNISKPLLDKPWTNFHSGKHDRKLRLACNESVLRGSYMTDLFKGINNPSSANFISSLDKKVIRHNVNYFLQEMKDIRIDNKTKFVVFGVENSLISKCFNMYFKPHFSNDVIYYYHYSYYTLTDKAWVKGFLNKINGDLSG